MQRLTVQTLAFMIAVCCVVAVAFPGVGVAAAGDDSTNDSSINSLSTSTAASPTQSQLAVVDSADTSEQVTEYKYVDTETNDVYRFSERPPHSELPDGEYLEVRTIETGDDIREETREVHITNDRSPTFSTNSHNSGPYELKVRHKYDEYDGASYEAGSTVDLWIGAANESKVIGNVDVTVTITTPAGDEETFSRTLGAEGNTELAYDTTGKGEGEFDVYIESPDGATGSSEIRVGPQIKVYPDNGQATIGNEVTASVLLSEDAEPIPNTQTSITIERPDGTEDTRSITTDGDGVGTFSFTPTQAGRYEFSADNYYGYGDIEAGEYVADVRVNGDAFAQDIRPGSTVGISGQLLDSTGAAAQQSLTAQVVRDPYGDEEIASTLSATTDDTGTFYTEWQAPAEINDNQEYEIRLEVDNDKTVEQTYSRFDVVEESEISPTLNVDVETQKEYALPGDTLNLQITATENNDPYANQELTLIPSVDFDHAIDTITVQTDNSGEASLTYTVPQIPDGSVIEFNADADFDGSIDAYDDISIQQYAVDDDHSYESTPGAAETYEINVTDVKTGDPVPDYPLMVAFERDDRKASVYHTDTLYTDSSGTASTTVTIPTDASGELRTNTLDRYDTYGPSFDVIGVDAQLSELDSSEYAAGKTLSVTYDGPVDTTAVLGVTTYEENAPTPLATEQVSPGDQFSFTIPSDAPQNTYYRIQGFAASTDGQMVRLSESVRVSESTDNPDSGELPAELEGSVAPDQYTAVLDGNDELTAGAISTAVNQWATTGEVNDVEIGASELSALVNYWAA